jgi:hypothetical protein
MGFQLPNRPISSGTYFFFRTESFGRMSVVWDMDCPLKKLRSLGHGHGIWEILGRRYKKFPIVQLFLLGPKLFSENFKHHIDRCKIPLRIDWRYFQSDSSTESW